MSAVARFPDPGADGQLEGMPRPLRALFLDRDGVINVNHGYVHAPGQVEWVDGIFELARSARAAGLVLVVVTNQAGIARGYYDEATFLELCDWIHARFREAGAPLLATYYCPHHPTAGIGELLQDCQCRKPAPGMLLAAAAEWQIDLGASCLLGDTAGDIEAARAAGVGGTALFTGGRLPGFNQLFPVAPGAK